MESMLQPSFQHYNLTFDCSVKAMPVVLMGRKEEGEAAA